MRHATASTTDFWPTNNWDHNGSMVSCWRKNARDDQKADWDWAGVMNGRVGASVARDALNCTYQSTSWSGVNVEIERAQAERGCWHQIKETKEMSSSLWLAKEEVSGLTFPKEETRLIGGDYWQYSLFARLF